MRPPLAGLYPEFVRGSLRLSRVWTTTVRIASRTTRDTVVDTLRSSWSFLDSVTGEDIAVIWADVLGRDVRYGGDDLDGMEQREVRRPTNEPKSRL